MRQENISSIAVEIDKSKDNSNQNNPQKPEVEGNSSKSHDKSSIFEREYNFFIKGSDEIGNQKSQSKKECCCNYKTFIIYLEAVLFIFGFIDIPSILSNYLNKLVTIGGLFYSEVYFEPLIGPCVRKENYFCNRCVCTEYYAHLSAEEVNRMCHDDNCHCTDKTPLPDDAHCYACGKNEKCQKNDSYTCKHTFRFAAVYTALYVVLVLILTCCIGCGESPNKCKGFKDCCTVLRLIFCVCGVIICGVENYCAKKMTFLWVTVLAYSIYGIFFGIFHFYISYVVSNMR